jgi:DNA excision repair protein ERCC-3
MKNSPANPLIVQNARTLLLDVHAPLAEEARAALLPFAELEKSPEHLHTYRISPLSLWNAASAALGPADVRKVLEKYSRYPVPLRIMDEFSGIMSRYGKIRLISPGVQPGSGAEDGDLFLTSDDEAVLAEIGAARPLEKLVQIGRAHV